MDFGYWPTVVIAFETRHFEMVKFELIKPTELYNVLNQCLTHAFVSDPCYIVLFDSRTEEDYDKSHIVTARRLKRTPDNDFRCPYEAELDCRWSVIVYDGSTSSLECTSDVVKAAEFLYDNGSREIVKVLEGGFQLFTRLYPYMRSEKTLYLPQELESFTTYPLEVVPGILYIGTKEHAGDRKIHRQMNISAHINCEMESDPIYQDCEDAVFSAQTSRDENGDLLPLLDDACDFIHEKRLRGHRVLIFSKRMIDRSVGIAIGYLMKYESMSLKDAWMYMRKVCIPMQPSWCHMQQLAEFGCKFHDMDKPIPLTEDEYYRR
ncbi:unnamed protein product [Heterobilharzia americana]|nr:unnamed protein product [Heterobilharzia americana]